MTNSFRKSEAHAYNNALPKLGLDLGTFASATWQLQLWAGLVLINFTFISNSYFQFIITNRAGRFPSIPTSAMQNVSCNTRATLKYLKVPNRISLFFYSTFFIATGVFSCNYKSERQAGQEKMLTANIGEKFVLLNIVDSSLKTLDPNFSSSDITIIDFWNTTCGPCIKEMQQFPRLLLGKEKKIRVISISVNQYWLWKETIKAHLCIFSFFSNTSDNWIQANLLTSEDQKWKNSFSLDREEEIKTKYSIVTFPAYMVIDKEGIILSRPESAVDFISSYVVH